MTTRGSQNVPLCMLLSVIYKKTTNNLLNEWNEYIWLVYFMEYTLMGIWFDLFQFKRAEEPELVFRSDVRPQ